MPSIQPKGEAEDPQEGISPWGQDLISTVQILLSVPRNSPPPHLDAHHSETCPAERWGSGAPRKALSAGCGKPWPIWTLVKCPGKGFVNFPPPFCNQIPLECGEVPWGRGFTPFYLNLPFCFLRFLTGSRKCSHLSPDFCFPWKSVAIETKTSHQTTKWWGAPSHLTVSRKALLSVPRKTSWVGMGTKQKNFF